MSQKSDSCEKKNRLKLPNFKQTSHSFLANLLTHTYTPPGVIWASLSLSFSLSLSLFLSLSLACETTKGRPSEGAALPWVLLGAAAAAGGN